MGFMDSVKKAIGWDEVKVATAATGPSYTDAEIIEQATIYPGTLVGTTKVVGTSNYQKALKWAAAEDGGIAWNPRSLAVLEFEPDNKFDKKAIKVTVGGRLIGYIAKSDHRKVAPVVRKAIKESGKATCGVVFIGQEQLTRGARLAIFDDVDEYFDELDD